MLSSLDVSDFIGSYPEISNTKDGFEKSNKNFTRDITLKKEFADLRLEPTEKPSDKFSDIEGAYLDDQIFMSRFMSGHTPFDEALVWHVMGTGKTRLAIALVEHYKFTLGKNFNKALVIVPGPEIENSYRRELEKAIPSLYSPKVTAKERSEGLDISETAKKKRVNAAISKTFEIVTLQSFINSLPKNKKLWKAQYSNRVIIIDEAHKLHEEISLDDESTNYKTMHEFMHVLMGTRKLLMTGTPIWDQVYGIASLMNLILPMDKQLPLGRAFVKKYFTDGKLTEAGEKELTQLFQGRISFLRPMMSTEKRYMTKPVPQLKLLQVFPSVMSSFQEEYAKKAQTKQEKKEIEIQGKIKERVTTGGAVWETAIDAATFVYPETGGGTYGSAAFKKYVTKTETGYRLDDKIKKIVRSDLAKLSSKFAAIAEAIKNNPKELVFIYSESITGAGAILLGLCLEALGMRWVNSDAEIKKANATQRRFTVISSDRHTLNSSSEIDKFLRVVNSPENKYGDHCQVVIAGEKFALGLSLKNFRQFHSVSPSFNISGIEQPLYRTLRYLSHIDLLEKERYVKLYIHAATYQNPKDESIDVYAFSLAEKKEVYNSQMHRLMKKVAVDCVLNYYRNVTEYEVPKSRECDYLEECNYECNRYPPENKDGKVWEYNIPKDDIDYTTYNLWYSRKEVSNIIQSISKLFQNYFALELESLRTLLSLPVDKTILLLQALEVAIDNRILIKNRYGFNSYLKEENGIVFLDSQITSTPKYENLIYGECPLFTETTDIDTLVNNMIMTQDYPLVIKFCKEPSSAIFNNLSFTTQILLLEYSFVKEKTSKKLPQAVKLVLSEFGKNIYQTSDGTYIHRLRDEEYRGESYDIPSKKILITGNMRMFSATLGKWVTITDPEVEEKYAQELVKKKKQVRVVSFDNNPYKAYAWVSNKDGKFRITLKPKGKEKKKQSRRGIVCKTVQIPELINIFVNHLGYFVKNEIKGDKKDLLKGILSQKGMDKVQGLSGLTADQLGSIATLLTFSKEKICTTLYKWFEKNDLLYKDLD